MAKYFLSLFVILFGFIPLTSNANPSPFGLTINELTEAEFKKSFDYIYHDEVPVIIGDPNFNAYVLNLDSIEFEGLEALAVYFDHNKILRYVYAEFNRSYYDLDDYLSDKYALFDKSDSIIDKLKIFTENNTIILLSEGFGKSNVGYIDYELFIETYKEVQEKEAQKATLERSQL